MPVRSALTRLQRLAYRTLTGLEGHAYPTYKPLLMPVRSTLIRLTNPCLPRHRRLLTGLEGRAYSTHEPLLTPVRSTLTTLERRQQRRAYHVNKRLLTGRLRRYERLPIARLPGYKATLTRHLCPLEARSPAYKRLLIVRLLA